MANRYFETSVSQLLCTVRQKSISQLLCTVRQKMFIYNILHDYLLPFETSTVRTPLWTMWWILTSESCKHLRRCVQVSEKWCSPFRLAIYIVQWKIYVEELYGWRRFSTTMNIIEWIDFTIRFWERHSRHILLRICWQMNHLRTLWSQKSVFDPDLWL